MDMSRRIARRARDPAGSASCDRRTTVHRQPGGLHLALHWSAIAQLVAQKAHLPVLGLRLYGAPARRKHSAAGFCIFVLGRTHGCASALVEVVVRPTTPAAVESPTVGNANAAAIINR